MDEANTAGPQLGLMPLLSGFRVYSSPHMADRKQVRFPRTKKRRIRKKWAKRPENYRTIPWDKVYRMGDAIYAHPAMIEKLKRQLAVAR